MLTQVSAPWAWTELQEGSGAGNRRLSPSPSLSLSGGLGNSFPDKQMTWKSQTKANTKEMEKYGSKMRIVVHNNVRNGNNCND